MVQAGRLRRGSYGSHWDGQTDGQGTALGKPTRTCRHRAKVCPLEAHGDSHEKGRLSEGPRRMDRDRAARPCEATPAPPPLLLLPRPSPGPGGGRGRALRPGRWPSTRALRPGRWPWPRTEAGRWPSTRALCSRPLTAHAPSRPPRCPPPQQVTAKVITKRPRK